MYFRHFRLKFTLQKGNNLGIEKYYQKEEEITAEENQVDLSIYISQHKSKSIWKRGWEHFTFIFTGGKILPFINWLFCY